MTPAERFFEARRVALNLEDEMDGKLLKIAGVRDPENPRAYPWPCSDITYDDHDASFEFKGVKDPKWAPAPIMLALWWELGFKRCWMCYTDGSQRYFSEKGESQ